MSTKKTLTIITIALWGVSFYEGMVDDTGFAKGNYGASRERGIIYRACVYFDKTSGRLPH